MQLKIKIIQNNVSPSIRNLSHAIGLNGRHQLLKAIGDEFKRQTISNFTGGGQYRDKNWPNLSPTYAKEVGHRRATLVKTGALRDSIKLSAPSGDNIKLYTTNHYAGYVAWGTSKMPPRNYWPLNNTNDKSFIRLVDSADRDMFKVITHRMTQLSSGAFPTNTNWKRSLPQYGTPYSQ